MTFHLTCDIMLIDIYMGGSCCLYYNNICSERDFNMDNNRYDSHRPRKRVSRQTLRRRQLTALFVIALLVLLFVLLVAHACSDNGKKDSKGKTKTPVTTITTTATATDPAITTTAVTTTAALTEPVNNSDFKLDKYSVFLGVGETDMPRVQGYPDGMGEADERWSSGDPTIATVDSIGNITGVKPGTCYVTLRSATDSTQEVMIKVTVRGEATDDTASPQSNTAEAPEPPVYDAEGLTYIKGVLIVNKSYGLPATFDPKLDPLCYQQFQALSGAAAKENLSIYIGSSYRSYHDQEIIYDNYVKSDGVDKADTYSARPGYSEHQTGLVIDCNTIDDAFGATPEAAWLAQHAHEYGFIIRYPQGKEDITGYQYEPWHIRYVGSKIATEMYNSGQCLEEYLGVDSKYE